jgi:hypothetical protein
VPAARKQKQEGEKTQTPNTTTTKTTNNKQHATTADGFCDLRLRAPFAFFLLLVCGFAPCAQRLSLISDLWSLSPISGVWSASKAQPLPTTTCQLSEHRAARRPPAKKKAMSAAVDLVSRGIAGGVWRLEPPHWVVVAEAVDSVDPPPVASCQVAPGTGKLEVPHFPEHEIIRQPLTVADSR